MTKIKFIFYCLIVLSFSFFFSCGKDGEENPLDDILEWEYGRNEYNMELGDTLRNFVLHIPDSYSDDQAVPLVMMLHGSSGSGTKFYNISGWVEKANEENFIAVFPTGLEYPIVENNGRKSTKWSSDGLVNDIPEGYPIYDDIPFIKELVELLQTEFNIDDKRRYICGFSNGGGFVKSRAIDELNDLFAAAATGGGLGIAQPQVITGRLMSLYNISGTRDPKIVIHSGEMEEVPIAGEELMAHEVYSQQVINTLQTLKLSDNYTELPSPPQYNILHFDNDESGQGNEFMLMLINDMGHNFPNGSNNPQGVIGVDHIWPWFLQYQLD